MTTYNIYKITDIDDNVYIGQTKILLRERKAIHKYQKKLFLEGRKKICSSSDLNDIVSYCIIDTITTDEIWKVNKLEQHYIDTTPNTVNQHVSFREDDTICPFCKINIKAYGHRAHAKSVNHKNNYRDFTPIYSNLTKNQIKHYF